MSDVGLYSGIYDQIREYAELLDDVLIALKTRGSRPEDPARQRLIEVLRALAKGRPADLSARMLGLVLQDSDVRDAAQWTRIATGLEKTEAEPWLVERLEQMAQAVEQKRAGTLARMRGWSRD